MGTKMAAAFAIIFMAKVETDLKSKRFNWPLVWKRFIDDIFFLWNTTRQEVTQFIEQANKHHQTIKFTNFLNTTVYKDERFNRC